MEGVYIGKEAHKVFIACWLLLKKRNKILLLRRFNTGYRDGEYTVLAGHMDGNETVKEAMKREAKEEADLDIDVKDMRVVHIVHRRDPDREYVDFYVAADKWSGEPKNMEPEKCDDLGWFDIGQLPTNIIPYIPIVIERIKNKEFYTEYGFEGRA